MTAVNPTRLLKPFRRATSNDATDMAELVNIAGDGLPLYLWAKKALPGQSAWDVGRERASRGMGGFAYRNTIVREELGKTTACLIGYPLRDSPELSAEDIPAMLVPLLELERLVPNSWFINVLATYPEYRGKGFGSELLRIAETLASDSECAGMSLIMSDGNAGARRLYERHGYREHATRPIVKEDWTHSGRNWELMVKDT
jgi:ribosomal protein S18 acetylase RimI-like enzyme